MHTSWSFLALCKAGTADNHHIQLMVTIFSQCIEQRPFCSTTEVAACAETSQWFSAGNAAHYGERYIASIYCGLA